MKTGVSLAVVKGKKREDLLDACVAVMSDEDSNGNNGIGYLWDDAKEYFGLPEDLSDIKEEDYSEKDWERFTNDNFLRETLLNLPFDVSDKEIVRLYYTRYSLSTINWRTSDGYEIEKDDEGRVRAIAYAYSY